MVLFSEMALIFQNKRRKSCAHKTFENHHYNVFKRGLAKTTSDIVFR